MKDILSRAKEHSKLKNQKRIIREFSKESLTIGKNGGLFIISPELISFVKILIDNGHKEHVLFDINYNPILIDDLQDFFDDILGKFTEVSNYVWSLSKNNV